jgi:hypothetical protein
MDELLADFMPVLEGHHGVFCFTPAAVAAADAARRRKAGGQGEGRPTSPGGGEPLSVAGRPCRADGHAGKVRTVELDMETADLLEARAAARGLSVAELVAEFLTADDLLKAGRRCA